MNDKQFNPEWVQAARNNSQDAIAELYNYAFQNVYLTIKSLVKGDEDTVLDLTQDTFIKAFHSLDGLAVDEKFNAWVKVTARNTALDWLRKKQPVLFSALATEDEGLELQIEDDRSYQLPEVEMDQQETARLIREILDTLSDGQRMAVSMYYYENMSIKEIARITGCKEGTIKALLHQGRKKIEAKVLELEKTGTKLYSIAPLPFFMLLLRKQGELTVQPNSQTLASILQLSTGAAQNTAGATLTPTSTASGAAATSAISSTAVKNVAGAAVGHTIRRKILAGILAAAIIGGAAGSAVYDHSHSNQPTDVPGIEDISRIESADTDNMTEETEKQIFATAEEAYRNVVEQMEFPQFAHKEDFDGDGIDEMFVLHDNTEFTLYDFDESTGEATSVVKESAENGFMCGQDNDFVQDKTYAEAVESIESFGASPADVDFSIRVYYNTAHSALLVSKGTEEFTDVVVISLDGSWTAIEYKDSFDEDTEDITYLRDNKSIGWEAFHDVIDDKDWDYQFDDQLKAMTNISNLQSENDATESTTYYDDLLEEYRSAIAGELNLNLSILVDSALTYDFHNGMMDDHGYFRADDGAKFYYAYYDINQDGMSEFLFATGGEHTLVDIWTTLNDVPLHIIGGFGRSPIQIRQNGMILNYTEGGAYDHEYNFYRFEGTAIDLTNPADQAIYSPDEIPEDASAVLADKYPLEEDIEWQLMG